MDGKGRRGSALFSGFDVREMAGTGGDGGAAAPLCARDVIRVGERVGPGIDARLAPGTSDTTQRHGSRGRERRV